VIAGLAVLFTSVKEVPALKQTLGLFRLIAEFAILSELFRGISTLISVLARLALSLR
jgi:hypothetical protein